MSEHAYLAGRRVPAGPAFAGRLARRGAPDDTPRPGALVPLALAGACMLALALVWAVAELVPAAHVRDARALYDLTLLSRPRVDEVANFLLRLLKPGLFVLWGVALVALALARERPRVALAVAVILGLAPLTSELLKPLLAHPHASVEGVQIDAASFPSGHSTAAAILALAAVLVAPRRWRAPVALAAAAFALAVGVALLILAWHMPSDVLGGYLVALTWTALAVAVLHAAERCWPTARTLG